MDGLKLVKELILGKFGNIDLLDDLKCMDAVISEILSGLKFQNYVL